MASCNPPRCLKLESGECTVPSPWVVFQHTVKGKSLTKREKMEKYKEFLEHHKVIRDVDGEGAYRAVLCLDLASDDPVVRRFVETLFSDVDEAKTDCNLSPELVHFFSRFGPVEIRGTNLSPCQVIAKYFLRFCVPKSELNKYAFYSRVGIGNSGVIVGGEYDGRKPVVIKIIPTHKPSDTHPIDLSVKTSNAGTVRIKSVELDSILKEFRLQRHVQNVFDDDKHRVFYVPTVFGKVAVLSSKDQKQGVAVFVMERIKHAAGLRRQTMFTTQLKEALRRHRAIPSVLYQLHTRGVIHGDLHVYNLLFPEDDSRPTVIDYGRSNLVSEIKNKTDAQKL